MQSPLPKKPLTPIIIGILFVIVAAALCKVGSNCSLGTWFFDQATQSSDDVSTGTSNQRIQHANQSNFATLVLQSEAPVLVDFYADWCGPCRRLAPVLEELAREMPEARIVKINVDQSPELAREYRVDSIPSLKVFRNGTVTQELVGPADKNELKLLLAP